LDEAIANGRLLVFADDWGRHPSSCQHLIAEMLPRYQVNWVNTIGMRPPRADVATLGRGLQKVKQWIGGSTGATPTPLNLRVLNPRMWPWLGGPAHRWLNKKLLLGQLNHWIASDSFAPIAITTIPIVADLMGELYVRRWVYYCVDDFGAWPGLDQRTLRQMEERVVGGADVIIAASAHLRNRLSAMGRPAHLLTHGVDGKLWNGNEEAIACPALSKLQPPLVVFWGVIDRRMDVAMINQLAADMTRGTIVLVGPEADADPALHTSRRVVRVAPLPIEALPGVAHAAAVLIMPYADLPVTRAMQPLKLKEYMASGKPAVVRRLPATLEWEDCLDLAQTPREFSNLVRMRIEGGLPDAQRIARRRLATEGWPAKALTFERLALQ
jgi:glycosyltransferase involved in cell wall biosynthesis